MSINRHFLRDDPFDHIHGRRDRTRMIIISHLSWDTKVARKLWGFIHSQQMKRKILFPILRSSQIKSSSNRKHVTLTTILTFYSILDVLFICISPLFLLDRYTCLSLSLLLLKTYNILRDSFTNSTIKEL